MFSHVTKYYSDFFLTFQFSSVAQSCPTLCDLMDCSTPGLPVHHQPWSLLKLMSIELVMPSNHLILCLPFLLPSVFPSIRVFSNESALRMKKRRVLEKTLESPLDCKETQPVHPTGDQSWVFTGRTDVEAETPILWPPHAKS